MTGSAPPAGAPDHPDLPVKPPLVYLAAIAVGYLIDHFAPLRVRPDRLVVSGMTLVGLGILLAAWAMLHFHRERTSVKPWKPTRVILESGPFAFTRNPLYLAFAILQVGLGLWHQRIVVALMALPAVLVIDRVVIRREEAYLERKFGGDYLGYKARVRRWL